MSIQCPWCNEDTEIEMCWNPDKGHKEICYGDSFTCPKCDKEIETEWDTGYYDPVTDNYTDGYGFAKRGAS